MNRSTKDTSFEHPPSVRHLGHPPEQSLPPPKQHMEKCYSPTAPWDEKTTEVLKLCRLTPLLKQGQLTRAAQDQVQSGFENIGGWKLQSSQGNLCQCWTTIMVTKRFCLMSKRYSFYVHLCLLTLVPSLCSNEKSLALYSSFPPFR